MTKDNFIRERSLEAYKAEGTKALAGLKALYKVSPRQVYRWVAEERTHGVKTPQKKRRPKGYHCVAPQHFNIIKTVLADQPLLFLKELVEIVATETGKRYTVDQVRVSLKKAGYTRKMLDYRAREQCAPARVLFLLSMNRFHARQMVFVDETHTKPEDVRRKYGYALSGSPAFMYIPNMAHGDAPPVAGICALSSEGIMAHRLVRQNISAEFFLRTLEEDILPHMNPFPLPRSVLILDNARTHNFEEISLLCDRFNVLVYALPPYSYDLSPIELAFHEAKEFIRCHYGIAPGELEPKLAQGLDSVREQSAKNYFKFCGNRVDE